MTLLQRARIFLVVIALLPGGATCSHSASNADDPAVRAMLTRYFETWSKQDMAGYGACFHDQARIIYISSEGRVISQGVTDFLHSQKLAHEQAATPMKEVPLEMKMQGDTKIMQAAVTWLLSKGNTEERGTDFFTLKREGNEWKIVSLVFYGE